MRVAGLMSGTSLDGIDVAIVDLEYAGERLDWKIVSFHSYPYAEDVRTALLGISNKDTHTAAVSRLHFLLGMLYRDSVIRALEESAIDPGSVELIGCHGQTIFHEPDPIKICGHDIASTLQIGEPAFLAEHFRVPVVSNFRPRDMASGGQGAPLVPYADYLLLRQPDRCRVALNIGGIANLTVLPGTAEPDRVIAFDTGPGNMILDALVERHTGGRLRYDRDGEIAGRGVADEALLDRLLDDPYLQRAPPKSTGRERYGREFVEKLLQAGLAFEDLMATVTAFTAASIAGAVQRFADPIERVGEIVVSGGGAFNVTLLAEVSRRLPGRDLKTSDAFGLPPDAKEAVAFAVLAHATWLSQPGNLPSATGAARPVVLGCITPG